MATKKQVNDAYFQGCCDVIEQLANITGININDLSLDMVGLEKYARENGFSGVLHLMGI